MKYNEQAEYNKVEIGWESSSKSRLRRVMTTVLLAFLLLVTYFLTWSYFNALDEEEKACLMRLSSIANALTMQIDGDAHQRLMAGYPGKDAISTNKQDSVYFAIHQVLQRNYVANMLKTPVYTIVLDTSNTCFFGVTSSEMPYFRHPYHSAPALLMEKHAEGAMIPRYQDEFGNWLSAFAAIRNSQGEVVALVQVDQNFDEFINQARSNVLKNLAVSLIGCLFFLVLLIRILQPILRKERLIKEALEEANLENRRINHQLQTSLEQVIALDGFRKEMIANLSHDLRTPLASILGYLETVLVKKSRLSELEQEKYLAVALSEANRLNRFVAALFELSKLESGNIQLEQEPLNMAELAQDTLGKYQLIADEKQVQLRTEFSENLPLAIADVRWIDRVLQNLMDNALRYVYQGGFVMLTIFESAGKLHFKVCNSGDPIPEADLIRVFDRYFKSGIRQQDSSGLGLTIVKKIMELHGERVWAESNEAVTTFRFTLPLYQAPAL